MMSMYSLYRAWLLRDTASIASPSLSLPPDLIITVPSSTHHPYQFIAHRALTASHSGYLKTAIAQQEEYAKTRPSLSQLTPLNSYSNSPHVIGPDFPSTPAVHSVLEVSLPSPISADIFSPLLTFMYTGYLDLNLQNIYELLLAVNVLQMPHALDLCRSYLLHNVHSVANLTFNSQPRYNLAKPIPGRGLPQSLSNDQKTDAFPHPEVVVDTAPLVNSTQNESLPPNPKPSIPRYSLPVLPPAPTLNRGKRRFKSSRRKLPKLNKAPRPSAAPADSDSSDDITVVTTEMPRSTCMVEVGGNTVVDIASCDGPVHFTRVLNEHYDVYRPSNAEQETSARDDDSEVEINIDENSSENGGGETLTDENEENIARHLETEASFQINFRHQIQRQNQTGGDAADKLKAMHPLPMMPLPASHPGTRSNQRRVIPRTVLKPVAPAASGSQREVRLLDMNVQYYPCKTCGAKFPSYYFVHKHRRRVHPEEEQQGGDVAPPPGTKATEQRLE